jgi:uncharacterized protein
MRIPDYGELQAAIGGPEAGHAIAEAHGTLCGLLCAGAGDLPDAWIHNTLADAEEYSFGGREDARSMLEEVHAATVTMLTDEDMSFLPLLPPEGAALEDRAAALASWCNGFLYGLAVRGLQPIEELPEELREILSDFSEIGRAGVAEEEVEEVGESALTELIEYVRVAVQLVHDACDPPVTDAARRLH